MVKVKKVRQYVAKDFNYGRSIDSKKSSGTEIRTVNRDLQDREEIE